MARPLKWARIMVGGELIEGDRNRGVVGNLHVEKLRRGDFENADQRPGAAGRCSMSAISTASMSPWRRSAVATMA